MRAPSIASAASFHGITVMRVLSIVAIVGLVNVGAVRTARLSGPSGGARFQPRTCRALLGRFDPLGRSAVSEGALAGVSAAMLRGGDTPLPRARGMADLEQPASAIAQ